ncbi:hypothetical protein KFE94_10715 [bacterium SCSIO 12643]|nr:hypothetical protein KFE94_10715 [bacterium SCSIO 12643]
MKNQYYLKHLTSIFFLLVILSVKSISQITLPSTNPSVAGSQDISHSNVYCAEIYNSGTAHYVANILKNLASGPLEYYWGSTTNLSSSPLLNSSEVLNYNASSSDIVINPKTGNALIAIVENGQLILEHRVPSGFSYSSTQAAVTIAGINLNMVPEKISLETFGDLYAVLTYVSNNNIYGFLINWNTPINQQANPPISQLTSLNPGDAINSFDHTCTHSQTSNGQIILAFSVATASGQAQVWENSIGFNSSSLTTQSLNQVYSSNFSIPKVRICSPGNLGVLTPNSPSTWNPLYVIGTDRTVVFDVAGSSGNQIISITSDNTGSSLTQTITSGACKLEDVSYSSNNQIEILWAQNNNSSWTYGNADIAIVSQSLDYFGNLMGPVSVLTKYPGVYQRAKTNGRFYGKTNSLIYGYFHVTTANYYYRFNPITAPAF